jgi:hypothetical protein
MTSIIIMLKIIVYCVDNTLSVIHLDIIFATNAGGVVYYIQHFLIYYIKIKVCIDLYLNELTRMQSIFMKNTSQRNASQKIEDI